MNARSFVESLLAAYPPALRPDGDFVNRLQAIVKKRDCTSQELEEACTAIVSSFNLFPTIAGVLQCLGDAHKQVFNNVDVNKAYEYFVIDGISYRRDVEISSSGNIHKKPLPPGAENYLLWLPKHLRHDDKPMSAEQAYREGVLSEDLYRQIKQANDKRRYVSQSKTLERFEKIGQTIKQEESIGFDDIDDSMAANPEYDLMDL